MVAAFTQRPSSAAPSRDPRKVEGGAGDQVKRKPKSSGLALRTKRRMASALGSRAPHSGPRNFGTTSRTRPCSSGHRLARALGGRHRRQSYRRRGLGGVATVLEAAALALDPFPAAQRPAPPQAPTRGAVVSAQRIKLPAWEFESFPLPGCGLGHDGRRLIHLSRLAVGREQGYTPRSAPTSRLHESIIGCSRRRESSSAHPRPSRRRPRPTRR
jgi:hypothetical protein